MTIEQICYERLIMSYNTISFKDFTKWQTKEIVEHVVKDANALAASEFILSVTNQISTANLNLK